MRKRPIAWAALLMFLLFAVDSCGFPFTGTADSRKNVKDR